MAGYVMPSASAAGFDSGFVLYFFNIALSFMPYCREALLLGLLSSRLVVYRVRKMFLTLRK
jgi:hypothetical protein